MVRCREISIGQDIEVVRMNKLIFENAIHPVQEGNQKIMTLSSFISRKMPFNLSQRNNRDDNHSKVG